MRRFERASSGAAGRPLKEQWALEDRYNDRVVAQCRALRKLLRAPAPDLAALALKIELVVDEEVATLSGGERCLAVLKADARRLCSSSRGA